MHFFAIMYSMESNSIYFNLSQSGYISHGLEEQNTIESQHDSDEISSIGLQFHNCLLF